MVGLENGMIVNSDVYGGRSWYYSPEDEEEEPEEEEDESV